MRLFAGDKAGFDDTRSKPKGSVGCKNINTFFRNAHLVAQLFRRKRGFDEQHSTINDKRMCGRYPVFTGVSVQMRRNLLYLRRCKPKRLDDVKEHILGRRGLQKGVNGNGCALCSM